MAFLRGLATGLLPLGPNIAETLRLRREQTDEQNKESQRRLRERVGLAMQSEDPETMEAVAQGVDEPALKGILTGKSRVLRQKKTDEDAARERGILDQARKEYLESGTFTPASDPNTAFRVQKMIESLQPQREKIVQDQQRKQRMEGIKGIDGELWDVGTEGKAVRLTPEKAEKAGKPDDWKPFPNYPGWLMRTSLTGEPEIRKMEGLPEKEKKSILQTSADIGVISDFDKGINLMQTLAGRLKEFNKKGTKTGPVTGRIMAWNPYDVEAQDLQSSIEMTRQIVGKALEGGVLRAEDVPKYKAILPTMNDIPEVALRKSENVLKALQEAKKIYVQNLKAGKGINVSGAEDKQARFEQLRQQAELNNWDLPDAEAQEYETLRQELGY